MNSDDARSLMHDWVQSEALRHHMECVATCMGAAADRQDPTQRDRWISCGLLHDFDYERHPTAEEHPFVGVAYLRSRVLVDEEILEAHHAEYVEAARQVEKPEVQGKKAAGEVAKQEEAAIMYAS